MIHGHCLCGGVRYEYDGAIEEISICHCSQCQRAQGSAFAAVSPIRAEAFRLLTGAERLKAFRSSPGKQRVFCADCGSPLYSQRDDLPGVLRLRLGTISSALPTPAQAYHIHVASQAAWHLIGDDWPRHSAGKP